MTKEELEKASLDDIVFDGRNKKYGAYELRKNYNKRLVSAFIGSIVPIVLVLGIVTLYQNIKKNDKEEVEIAEVELAQVEEPIEEAAPPPPPPPPPPPDVIPQEKIADFATPKLVDEAPEIKEVKEIKESKVGNENVEGTKVTDNTPPPPPPPPPPAPAPSAPAEVAPVVKVDVQAKYNGDWNRYLVDKMESLMDGVEGEDAVVNVRFVVDVDGSITNVQALSGPPHLKTVAIKAIQSSGRWVPAELGGKPVKAYRTQPIRFVSND